MKMMKLRAVVWAGLAGMTAIVPFVNDQSALADDRWVNSVSRTFLLAQDSGLGCRRTNASTGVYEQPNLDSTSRGILNASQTIRLERKGEGWARISQPIVGWVQSQYLSPAVSCDPLGASTIQSPPAVRITASPPASPSPSPAPSPAPSPDAGVRATCDVVPEDGLTVRSEPIVDPRTFLTSIPAGTHEFQFTRETRVTRTDLGDRRWVYITAPAQGWISLGIEGRTANLGGRQCG
jgi:hypothetical protein